MNRSTGFTMVELLIVVAIIGILAAVAMPAYTDYVRRSRLPEGSSRLATLRIKLEQYYQDNRKFGTNNCSEGTVTLTDTPASKYWTYECELTNLGQGYKLTAKGSIKAANDHVYTLTDQNVQATTTFKGAASAKACWLVKGDEC
ncbi:type IV pilin protein [Pelomonas sp. SE-A7]|uniref:type IV pilin protein n=1 Tax=Pelomonas sp. SE-A7 TaxID=3054953 RepID=UPI00259CC2BC|nr:type IV pilin protein [Pelomonas sp. SE-A7]MDM4767716.1 type IV pilin protein [Pelomonas sp. SE-A7]